MTVHKVELEGKSEKFTIYISSTSMTHYDSIKFEWDKILSESEFARYSSFAVGKVKRQYFVGRYTCKKALSKYLGENNLSKIEIISGILGQPIVKYLSDKNPCVSLSHNEKYALAVAFPEGYPISVDIESIDEKKLNAIETQLTDKEKQFTELGILSKEELYTVIWTIKESLSKVIKCGLLIPFRILEIDRLELSKGVVYAYFVNFPQYKSVSWVVNGQAFSIVTPKNVNLPDYIESIGRNILR